MENVENKAENANEKAENKIESIEGNELENVSGGFWGDDWSDAYHNLYKHLGIKHVHHRLHKDEYYRGDEKITREDARAEAEDIINMVKPIIDERNSYKNK